MKTMHIRVITAGGGVLYYTGSAGKEWLSEDITDAFEYSERAGKIRISQFYETYGVIGLSFDLVEKPNEVYFSLVDNCGDEIVGHQRRGGLSLTRMQEIASDLAARYKRSRGQARVVVRDVTTWQVIENLELPA